MKRVILIVLDGVGIGELPDANLFGDLGTNTLGNVAKKVGGLNLPNMGSLGIGNIQKIRGVNPTDNPLAAYGKAGEQSKFKDSVTGHWEISGIIPKVEFSFFPDGFPKKIIDKFCHLTDVPGVLLNKPYSGTDALRDFGVQHLKTKKPIVYTSGDSVFQIAVSQDIYSTDALYKMCEIARYDLFDKKTNIGRVIARPFLGNSPETFYRTENRKDYSLSPTDKTVLDNIKEAGKQVIGVGKIEDLFNFQGLTQSYHSKNNQEGIDYTLKFMNSLNEDGLIFTNLVDFDTKWGHRNLPFDFGKGLEYFDNRLKEIISNLKEDDILILTADHGCDPTSVGTDHTREYIPLIVLGSKVMPIDLGIRKTFSDIGATISDYLGVKMTKNGKSFLRDIYNEKRD